MQSVAKGGGCCAEIRRFGRRSCAPQLTGGLIMAAVRGAAAACSAWRIDARSLRGLRSIGFHLEQLMKLGRANGTKSGSDAREHAGGTGHPAFRERATTSCARDIVNKIRLPV